MNLIIDLNSVSQESMCLLKIWFQWYWPQSNSGRQVSGNDQSPTLYQWWFHCPFAIIISLIVLFNFNLHNFCCHSNGILWRSHRTTWSSCSSSSKMVSKTCNPPRKHPCYITIQSNLPYWPPVYKYHFFFSP